MTPSSAHQTRPRPREQCQFLRHCWLTGCDGTQTDGETFFAPRSGPMDHHDDWKLLQRRYKWLGVGAWDVCIITSSRTIRTTIRQSMKVRSSFCFFDWGKGALVIFFNRSVFHDVASIQHSSVGVISLLNCNKRVAIYIMMIMPRLQTIN